jgi:hypothetical protein
VSHNISYSVIKGSSGEFDIIYDGYLMSGPNTGHSVIEFSVSVHTGGSCPALVAGHKYAYTDSHGFPWDVYINTGPTPHQFTFFPAAPGCPDVAAGTIELKDMFLFLVKQGVLTGSEYFGGFGIGPETFDNITSGTVTINSVAVTYAARQR